MASWNHQVLMTSLHFVFEIGVDSLFHSLQGKDLQLNPKNRQCSFLLKNINPRRKKTLRLNDLMTIL